MTLDEFVNEGTPWPRRCIGLRVKGGKVVWGTAHYPDGCSGNRVCVGRIVHEDGQTFTRVAYYDRDTEIEFVYPDAEGYIAGLQYAQNVILAWGDRQDAPNDAEALSAMLATEIRLVREGRR
jgi:hypothetical protein